MSMRKRNTRKQTSPEEAAYHIAQEERGLQWQLVGVFVLISVASFAFIWFISSTTLQKPGQVFFMPVGPEADPKFDAFALVVPTTSLQRDSSTHQVNHALSKLGDLSPSAPLLRHVLLAPYDQIVIPSSAIEQRLTVLRILETLRQAFMYWPTLEWYIVADAAHFLFLDNLHQFLSQKNTGIYANLNATHPNALSSALIVSQSALQELVNRKVEFIGCVESTDPESSVDTLLHTCLFNLALKITVPQEMHCNDPLSWDQWPFRPCGRPLAISYRTERLKRSINAMNATYADLFQFYQPRSLNTKRTSVDGKMMASIDQCRMECDRDQRCLSWSFSKGVCFMNPDIPGSEFVPNAVSGLCKARYTCSKDTNRPCQPIGHFDRERIKARGESISKRRWH